jgi:hypothetical protein
MTATTHPWTLPPQHQIARARRHIQPFHPPNSATPSCLISAPPTNLQSILEKLVMSNTNYQMVEQLPSSERALWRTDTKQDTRNRFTVNGRYARTQIPLQSEKQSRRGSVCISLSTFACPLAIAHFTVEEEPLCSWPTEQIVYSGSHGRFEVQPPKTRITSKRTRRYTQQTKKKFRSPRTASGDGKRCKARVALNYRCWEHNPSSFFWMNAPGSWPGDDANKPDSTRAKR